ncbi:MAG: acyltransferase family protein [Caldilineaceae bacterium]
MTGKGVGSFVKDRLLRLGIPLVLWVLVLGPLTSIGLYLEPNPRIAEPLTWQHYRQAYPYLLGLGPLWFVALLLIFSVGYVAWRLVTGNRVSTSPSQPAQPTMRVIGLFALALALVSTSSPHCSHGSIGAPVCRLSSTFPPCLPAAVSQLLHRRCGRLRYADWFEQIQHVHRGDHQL